jgi:hypothetical protein
MKNINGIKFDALCTKEFFLKTFLFLLLFQKKNNKK